MAEQPSVVTPKWLGIQATLESPTLTGADQVLQRAKVGVERRAAGGRERVPRDRLAVAELLVDRDVAGLLHAPHVRAEAAVGLARQLPQTRERQPVPAR